MKLRLSYHLNRRLDALAKSYGRDKAEIVRMALRKHASSKEEDKELGCSRGGTVLTINQQCVVGLSQSQVRGILDWYMRRYEKKEPPRIKFDQQTKIDMEEIRRCQAKYPLVQSSPFVEQ
jgi:hypothetical protein